MPKIEVDLILSGSSVKARVDRDALPWSNTSERIIIMNRLRESNIIFDRIMSTSGLKKLYERHEDKKYVPLKLNFGYWVLGSIRKCVTCGEDYVVKAGNQMYCNKKCHHRSKGKIKRLKIRNLNSD